MNLISYKGLDGSLKHNLNLSLQATLNASLGNKPASSDVTPNVVNWANLGDVAGTPSTNNTGLISGISTTIDIRIRDYTGGVESAPTVKYKISATTLASTDYETAPGTWTSFTFTGSSGNRVSNAITISNNQHVGFAVTVADLDTAYYFEVQNVSSANTVIDTFISIVSF